MHKRILLLIFFSAMTGTLFSQTSMPASGKYSIAGITTISAGQGTKLSIAGVLPGSTAKWTWYSENCGGTVLGTGSSFLVSPAKTTTYYARTEGMSNCIYATVYVNNNSVPPDEIMGDDLICKGERDVRLTVLGGILGRGARWVWYEGSCNFRKIGEGSSVSVSPVKTTDYFVRAEGGSNVTECRSFRVNVSEPSVKPLNIIGPAAVCVGQTFELKVSGGRLGTNAEWVWYEGNPTNKVLIGKGNMLSGLSLKRSATYFVAAEGECGKTEYISKNIIVNVPAINAASIKVPPTYKLNQTIVLELAGYNADKSNLIWYEGACSTGKKIGTGARISYNVTGQAEIFVKDISECPENDCKRISLAPINTVPSGVVTFVNAGFVNNNLSDLNSFSNLSLSVGGGGRFGWYGRIKVSINQDKSTYETNNSGLTDYEGTGYYQFNGKILNKRFGATAGLVYTQRPISLYVGAGYGSRDLQWGITEFAYISNEEQRKAWAKNVESSFKGPEIEGGIILRFGFFNILGGIGSVDFKYMDAHVGIGYNIK
ncbi:MAG TPA: hypothetical protein VGE26_12490 [Sphingobacteriaceae bacterium]